MRPNWFVGMPVDAGDWLAPLVADAPSNLRLFHPDDLHMTVAFLGDCGEERARAAFAVVRRHPRRAFEVTLGGLAPMGNPRRPSALSALLEKGLDEAVALIEALQSEICSAAGIEPDHRPPKPHVTVARPPRRASLAERDAAVAWAESKPPIDTTVVIDRVSLYTWSEDRRLRQFRVVATHALHGNLTPS